MRPPNCGVLLLNPFDAHAGSQRIGRVIVASLQRAGIGVSIRLGFGGRGFISELPDVAPDIRCDHVPIRKLLYPLWALTVLIPTAWAASRGRTVWANTIYAVVPALLAILLFPRRTVVHLHETTFPLPFRPLLKLAAWRGSTILCVSADQAQRIGVAAEILPNPVARPKSDPVSRRNRLLFVGTTQPFKGFALFVLVCERLKNLPLKKVAYLSDGAAHDKTLVASARAIGIEIVFGERSPAAMYNDGFLLLVCSDPRLVSETFSLVAAEAVAWLVPVAGAGVTVLPEVIGDALAFNDFTRDPDLIAKAIANLLGDPDRHAALRAACEARRSHFSEEAFTNRIVRLLRHLETS